MHLGQCRLRHLAGALKSYRDSFAIRDRLAKSDPKNLVWQSRLAWSYDKIGDMQKARVDLARALKSYRDSLAIREGLAASDRSNTDWQLDFSLSSERIGDVQKAQSDLAGALKSYRDSLAIREALAASDRSNTEWQHDLALSCDNIGDVQKAQGDLACALISYSDSLAVRERLYIGPDAEVARQCRLGTGPHMVQRTDRRAAKIRTRSFSLRQSLHLDRNYSAWLVGWTEAHHRYAIII